MRPPALLLCASLLIGLAGSQPCTVATVAGPLAPASGYTEGTGTAARFNNPRGVAVDTSGYELFVADSSNQRVRAVVIATGATRVLSGSGATASTDGTGALAAHSSPFALALSSGGLLFVTDRATGKIRRVTTSSGVVVTIGGTGTLSRVDGVGTSTATFSAPSGLALDEPGNLLYISDCISSSTLSCLLRRMDLASGQVTTLAGRGVTAAYADGVGTNALFQANMYSPLLLGSLLYLTDSASNRLRVMDMQTLQVSTVAGSGASSDINGVGLAAAFKGVDGIVANATGWLFVIELNGGTLRRVNNQSYAVTTLAFTGAVGNADGPCATATINSPQFIALDARTGNLFVSDTANHNIRSVISVPASSSASPLPSPSPCVAGPGYFCSGGVLTACAAGTFSSAPGATACAACPGGHFCPPATASWALLNCGRGAWCPRGATAPQPCPVLPPPPPFATWAQHPLGAQGPAFLVETASCANHCFWNTTNGDGRLSRC